CARATWSATASPRCTRRPRCPAVRRADCPFAPGFRGMPRQERLVREFSATPVSRKALQNQRPAMDGLGRAARAAGRRHCRPWAVLPGGRVGGFDVPPAVECATAQYGGTFGAILLFVIEDAVAVFPGMKPGCPPERLRPASVSGVC